MNLIAHSIRSKGRLAFVRRVGSIAWRFGLTPAKTENSLNAYIQTLRRHAARATFPITASVLRRHRQLVRRLARQDVEFAVHGYTHTDHALLSFDQQRAQIGRALGVFRDAGLEPEGFRGPYLRHNGDTIAAVRDLGFRYSSNKTVYYDVLDTAKLDPSRLAGYRKALELYSAIPAKQTLVRPTMVGDLVELPVAMPDDEILIDRLGYQDGLRLGQVWRKVLERSYQQSDLLTLQLHPERGALCRQGLDALLTAARSKTPPVWIAQLREIARWWLRRRWFRLSIERLARGQWLIVAPEDAEATVLLRNIATENAEPWYGDCNRLRAPSTVVDSVARPVIGVSPQSTDLELLLHEEGYPVQIGHGEGCALYLDRPDPLNAAEQLAVLRQIDQSDAPLVRIGRWPSGARSALAITGDIDAVTLLDFVLRTWEVHS